ncbi:hypothetical protein DAPPUDRAFT_236522 [Daphnia pulex]|uniref:Uncharacterized protein n=1 Tax=Daphnia pulex TaxID=6669 RepID=E9G176_DAPPU|nr:hypothetical protein DAPPUDRAFT_236522 [Daphnia pulex]|eukprot:EFX86691.1 hypothetical protein DAPPUDRAFT_236522 [Daphnia pulex]
MPYYIITNMIKCASKKRARKIPTDILEPMLDFVHDRRGTSTNILLHPYLQDSSSFTASVLLMPLVLLHNFSCFTGELDHFSCCDTPAVTSILIFKTHPASVMQRKNREDEHQNVAGTSKMSSQPVGCHAFVLPCTGRAVRSRGLQAAGSESRQAQNLPQGACYKAMHLSPPLVSTDLSAMASPTLVMDP